MPGETSLLQLGLWVLMAVLALVLIYVAIVFRLQPVFLLPLAGGLLFANLPIPGLTAALTPFFLTLQGGLYSGLYPALILLGWGAGATLAYLIPAPRAAFPPFVLFFWGQPYLVDLLTSKQERMLRMPPSRKVSRRESLLFAGAGLVLTLILVPWAALLTGMFFLGNLLKESGVVDRLARR